MQHSSQSNFPCSFYLPRLENGGDLMNVLMMAKHHSVVMNGLAIGPQCRRGRAKNIVTFEFTEWAIALNDCHLVLDVTHLLDASPALALGIEANNSVLPSDDKDADEGRK